MIVVFLQLARSSNAIESAKKQLIIVLIYYY